MMLKALLSLIYKRCYLSIHHFDDLYDIVYHCDEIVDLVSHVPPKRKGIDMTIDFFTCAQASIVVLNKIKITTKRLFIKNMII